MDDYQAQIAALAAERDALKAELSKSRKQWRCFNCGFETTNEEEAVAHFGERDDAEETTPHCRWWQRMSPEERGQALQDTILDLNRERDEVSRLLTTIEGLEYRVDSIESEISSRFKNCRTIQEAWCLYDSMEGRALAAEEQRDALAARNAAMKAMLTRLYPWLAGVNHVHLPDGVLYASEVWDALQGARDAE